MTAPWTSPHTANPAAHGYGQRTRTRPRSVTYDGRRFLVWPQVGGAGWIWRERGTAEHDLLDGTAPDRAEAVRQAAQGVEQELERLQRVAAEVKRSQLKALLSEPQEGNRSFNALAKDLGVKVVVFDPMETATEQASRDPATYLQVMRRNVADLRQAFGQ